MNRACRELGALRAIVDRPNGCTYLIRDAYYNSDLAADVLRGLPFLSEELGASEFLYGARAFADWHVRNQRADGAWYITIDRQGTWYPITWVPATRPTLRSACFDYTK